MNNNTDRKFKPFHGVNNDPAFLVAKGRFDVPAQTELTNILDRCKHLILVDGLKPDHPDIKLLQEKAKQAEQRIEAEQKLAERRHIKKLASAVSMAIMHHGRATLRSVGQRASYNAQKAVAIATEYCEQKGIEICSKHEFDSGNIGTLQETSHAQNVTAMLLKLVIHKDWLEEGDKNG